jgi:hypothetical protein
MSPEEGVVGKVANEWLKLLKLGLGKCFSSEPRRVIRLRARFGEWNGVVPAFIYTFN